MWWDLQITCKKRRRSSQRANLRAASCAAWTRLTFGIEEMSNGCAAAAGSATYATSFDSKAANENTDSRMENKKEIRKHNHDYRPSFT